MLFRNAAVARSGFEHNGSAVSTLAGLLWQRLPAEVKAQWKVESIALERRAKEYLSMQPMSRRPGVKRNPHLPSRNTISLTDQDTESSLTHPPMLVPSMTYLTTTPSSSLQPYYNRAITFPTASVTYNPKRDAFSPPPRPRAPSPTQSKHHPSQFTTSSPDPSIAFQSLMLGNFRTSTPAHMFDNAERPPIKIPTLPSQVEYGLGGFTPTTYFPRGTTPACSPVPTLLSCNSSAPSSSFSTPYLPCYPPSMLSINNESDTLLYNSYQEMLTNSVGLGLELTLNTIPKAFPNIIFTPIPTYATNFNPSPFPNLNFIFNELSSENDGSAINQSQPTMTGSSAFPSDELEGLTEHWDETMSRL
ncbi:hypothetical protein QCA50_000368 [Cerrena zonata]|uniref:HMG box domain-containing protein n=1 Tax=Cerrena zonata TaxID=2478898 RepID=A0AAW0GUF6_9APHY